VRNCSHCWACGSCEWALSLAHGLLMCTPAVLFVLQISAAVHIVNQWLCCNHCSVCMHVCQLCVLLRSEHLCMGSTGSSRCMVHWVQWLCYMLVDRTAASSSGGLFRFLIFGAATSLRFSGVLMYRWAHFHDFSALSASTAGVLPLPFQM
jgi:hypothetical protein